FVQATGDDILYADGSDNFDAAYSNLVKDYIQKNGFKRYWDDSAKAPYLYNGDVFITYDDEESIFLKGQYIVKEELAGGFYWENSHDPTGTLLRALVDGMGLK